MSNLAKLLVRSFVRRPELDSAQGKGKGKESARGPESDLDSESGHVRWDQPRHSRGRQSPLARQDEFGSLAAAKAARDSVGTGQGMRMHKARADGPHMPLARTPSRKLPAS